MVFSLEDEHLIKTLRESKKFSSRGLLKEFPDRGWKRSGLDNLRENILYWNFYKNTFKFCKVV